MKKFIRVLIPILLVLTILLSVAWYLFVYDREFTRDMLLSCARHFESKGSHSTAAWFYEKAYRQAGDNDDVAIELAMQYKKSGNYTKAEYTLTNAIADGGTTKLYVALSKLFVEQDKLMDAVKLMDAIQAENSTVDPQVRQELSAMRPAAPTTAPEPGFYSQYIDVTVTAQSGTLYVNPNGEYPSYTDEPSTEPIKLHDGENTLYAVAVSQDGIVSPLSIFGYTVGGVVEEVEFADPAVEKAIREALGVSQEQTLMSNDLWTLSAFTVPSDAKCFDDVRHMVFLQELTISGAAGSSLACLSPLTHLTTLKIIDTPVSGEDIPFIGNLPKLETLTLQNCGLSTISGLENARSLRQLDLSENTLRNLSPLADLTTLETLQLQHNALNDLSALSGLTALNRLDVSYNSLPSLSPLSGISALRWMDASHNAITSLSGMEKLTGLNHLYLGNNQLTEINLLQGCTELQELGIGSNLLTDLSPLSGLSKLAWLDFSYNEVTALPTFPENSALVHIDGSYNKLSSLSTLKGLQNLNNVYMDYNENISSVSDLASCPVLIQVNVYGTKVKEARALTEQSVVVNYDPT